MSTNARMVPLEREELSPEALMLEEAFTRFNEASNQLQVRYDLLRSEFELLQEQLREKTEEVKRHERLSMLGETAAAIAHEVRNPLGAIKLFLSLLRQDVEQNPGSVKLVDQIDSSITSLDHVVSNILHFAKSSVGPLSPVNIHALIQEQITQSDALHRGVVSVKMSLMANPFVMGEEHSLRQVLRNLIINSLQAMRYQGALEIRSRDENGSFVLEIQDSGPGIPEHILPRLGEPFVTGRKEGTGLGLAISRRIVNSIGGELTGENVTTGGALFRVRLSRQQAANLGTNSENTKGM